MKLIFKQRIFSWFDSYDIYDEYGNTVFTVEGKMSWGKKLHVNDASGAHVATLQQRIFSFMPTFDIFLGERQVGSIKKALFKHSLSYLHEAGDVGTLDIVDVTVRLSSNCPRPPSSSWRVSTASTPSCSPRIWSPI